MNIVMFYLAVCHPSIALKKIYCRRPTNFNALIKKRLFFSEKLILAAKIRFFLIYLIFRIQYFST